MKQKGFTLIELLLYVSTIGITLLITSAFLYTIFNSRVKNQSVAEVEQSGIQVMQLLTQSIRNSAAVNSPVSGASAVSLSINTTDAANNPTVFDLDNGNFRIKEGNASEVNLTSTRVTVSDLSFRNLDNSVKIQFTLSHVDSGNRNEYSYSETFYGTANLRP